MRKVTVLASLLLLAPAISQAKTLDDLLVEKGVITKAEAQAAAGAGSSKTYYDGGTRFDFPDTGFSAKFNTFIQTRYTFTDTDGSDNVSSFSVEKARVKVSGSAVHNEFDYALEGEFAGEGASLKDAWLQWNACDWVSAKMGQYKVPVGRQWNNSDSSLQFPDRSVASDYFSRGRNQGLTLAAKSEDGAWEAKAGIFNGESDGEGVNSEGVDTDHMAVVGLRWNAMGSMKSNEEGDVAWTDDMALSLGAGYAYSQNAVAAAGADVNQTNIYVDGNFKWKGWSAHAEYFLEDYDIDIDGSDAANPMGFYVQLGYFLDPKTWELAARYGLLDCDDGAASDGACSGNEKVNQVTVGVNYYWWAHHMKAQIAYEHINERALSDSDDDVNTDQWILQLSAFM